MSSMVTDITVPGRPEVTFADEIAVHAGDLRAQVRYVGTAAHTTNDSIVWIPERSVLPGLTGAQARPAALTFVNFHRFSTSRPHQALVAVLA
jgi:hypothetical protein